MSLQTATIVWQRLVAGLTGAQPRRDGGVTGCERELKRNRELILGGNPAKTQIPIPRLERTRNDTTKQ